MGCFTPYENFKTLTTNDLQFHSPIRFNQSGPGMPVSKPSTHTPDRLACTLARRGRCMYNHIKILAINRSSKRAEIAPIKKETVQTLGFTSFPRSFHAAPHGATRYTEAHQGTLWLTKVH